MNSTMMVPGARITQSTIAGPPKENTRRAVPPRHFGSAIESSESLDSLIPIVYVELRPIAHAQLSREHLVRDVSVAGSEDVREDAAADALGGFQLNVAHAGNTFTDSG